MTEKTHKAPRTRESAGSSIMEPRRSAQRSQRDTLRMSPGRFGLLAALLVVLLLAVACELEEEEVSDAFTSVSDTSSEESETPEAGEESTDLSDTVVPIGESVTLHGYQLSILEGRYASNAFDEEFLEVDILVRNVSENFRGIAPNFEYGYLDPKLIADGIVYDSQIIFGTEACDKPEPERLGPNTEWVWTVCWDRENFAGSPDALEIRVNPADSLFTESPVILELGEVS